MQEIAPELKAIQEKHKGDPQALSRAQMELYRKYKINPLGPAGFCCCKCLSSWGCISPCRKASFSVWSHSGPPGLITSPLRRDVLVGGKHPLISRPVDTARFCTLVPLSILLPLFAMGFMVLQQKWFMPPPHDRGTGSSSRRPPWS